MMCFDRLNNLSLGEEYKSAIRQYCSSPENKENCQLLCSMEDQELVEAFKKVESTIAQWGETGMLQKVGKEIGDSQTKRQPVQNFANGGLAALGRNGDNTLAHVQSGEMIVPNEVMRQNPGMRQGIMSAISGIGADPRRYTAGTPQMSINPQTGKPEFFLDVIKDNVGAVVGAIAGIALGPAGAIGGSIAAGIGATAGSMVIDGKSFGDALKRGAVAGGLTYGAHSIGMLGSSATDILTYAETNGITVAEAAETLGATPSVAKEAMAMEFSGNPAMAGAVKQNLAAETAKKAASNLGPVSQPTQTASKTIGKPSFSEFIEKGGDQVLYSGDKFNLTAGDVAKGLPFLMSAFEDKQPADTNPFKNSLFNQVPENLKNRNGILDMPAYKAAQRQTPVISSLQGRGLPGYACGGHVEKDFQRGGPVAGPGTTTSDSIPARLSDGEFVMTANAVQGMGNGDLREGARKMYALMDRLERRNG